MITASNVIDAILDYVKASFNESAGSLEPDAYLFVGMNGFGTGSTHADDDAPTSESDALKNKREHATVMLDAFIEAKTEMKVAEMLSELKSQLTRRAPAPHKSGYHPLYDEG